MSEFDFEVLGAEPEKYTAEPVLNFRIRVTESTGEVVHAIVLRTQVRIEPQRRRYSDEEREAMADLFGRPEQWGTSLKPFVWTHETVSVSGFEGKTEFDIPVTCTYDFEVRSSKYMHSIDEGEVPLILLFSGTVFTRGATGFSVEQLSWERDARYQLPVSVWDDLMRLNYGGSGWLRLNDDTIDALQRFKASHGVPTYDRVIEQLLDAAEEEGEEVNG